MRTRTNTIRASALVLAFSLIVAEMNYMPVRAESKGSDEMLIPYAYSKDDDFVNDRIIVVLKQNASELNRVWNTSDFDIENIKDVTDLTYMRLSAEKQIEYLNDVDFHQILRVSLTNTGVNEVYNAIAEFEKDDRVLLVTPDCTVTYCSTTPDDPYIPSNYYAFSNTQLYQAWDVEIGSSDVKIGIIDSGIAYVPDLVGNVDYTLGYDFYNENTLTYDDTDGHGTVVASVAGAIGNNSTGVCGVCWDVSLVPLQTAGGTSSHWIQAITYATANDISILNLSGAVNGTQTAMQAAISNYPGLFVCSAGNSGINVDDTTPIYPRCFTNENIVAVAASNSSDNLLTSSNYGPISIDLAAPGDYLRVANKDGTYGTNGGTSLAAPMVAGAAALLLSYNPNLSALQLKEAILKTVDVIPSMAGKTVTEGRLNVYQALEYVKSEFQLQNIVVNVRVTPNSGLTSFRTSVKHNKQIDSYYSMVHGSVLGSSSGLTHSFTYDSNDLNQRYDFIQYNGAAIMGSGIVYTYRYTSRLNQNIADFSSLIETDSNASALSFEVVVIGDLNDDGYVTQDDQTILLQYISGSYSLSSTQRIAADVNFNSSVNLSDAVCLAQYIAGTINTFY